MMSENNQCSLDGLDEEFRMLNTNGQLPPGEYEEKKMDREGDEQSLDAADNKNKLTFEWLPAEVLAICLSYTGKDLPKARLTCRRFNQIIEDYEYMMNVIPVEYMVIEKEECQDFFPIEQVTLKKIFKETTCKLDELMKYVRFLRLGHMYFIEHFEATIHFETSDMKKYLTESWRKGIVSLNLHANANLLSIFPNVRELNIFFYYDPSVTLSAEISAHPSPIRRFRLKTHDTIPVACEEGDLILDALSMNSNKFNDGTEGLNLRAFCSIEAIIRFLENGKFAEKFDMSICVKNFNEYVCQGYKVYVENSGYQKFNNWLRSKGIPLPQLYHNYEFVYRATQFSVAFICFL